MTHMVQPLHPSDLIYLLRSKARKLCYQLRDLPSQEEKRSLLGSEQILWLQQRLPLHLELEGSDRMLEQGFY